MSIESVMPSNHLILCRPLPFLPPIPPSIRVFSNESTLHMRWPKYWSFSFSISPSNECPGLISFRMDQLDFLAVQGTLKNESLGEPKGRCRCYQIRDRITRKNKPYISEDSYSVDIIPATRCDYAWRSTT